MLKKTVIDKELMILGEPIWTSYGTFHFLSYREYIEYAEDLSVISLSLLHYYYMYRDILIKENAPRKSLIALMDMKEIKLFDFIRDPMNYNLLESYTRVFGKMLKHDTIDYSDPKVYYAMEEEDFLTIRKNILTMNLIKEEKLSPSPKVQRHFDMAKKRERETSGAPNTEAILTSLHVALGLPYRELLDMTAYQIMASYHRIHAFSDYFMSTLFATVSPDVELVRWDKNNDLLSDKTNDLSDTELQKIGDMLKD